MQRFSPTLSSSATTLATLLLAACAANTNVPPEQVNVTPQTVRVESPNGGVLEARTTAEDRAAAVTIAVKPEVAWAKLPAVYEELALPVNLYVDQTKQIAAKSAHVRGRLGKTRLGQLITCGTDITGEEKANIYEVTLDVGTAVSAAPDGKTHVLTMVTANARPMATSGDPVRCVTTGQLEKRIANAILIKSASTP